MNNNQINFEREHYQKCESKYQTEQKKEKSNNLYLPISRHNK